MYEGVRLSTAMRMARAASFLTQQELAEETGVSKSIIARNEKHEMAMRADTWIRLEHVMQQHGIALNLIDDLDRIHLYVKGENLEIVGLRATRAALNITQQELADYLEVSKNVVTRAERPNALLRSDFTTRLAQRAYALGININATPITGDLTITVEPNGLVLLESLGRGEALRDDPETELLPTTLQEKLMEGKKKQYKVQRRSDG
jgi:transcriptional regulator with XRE-family HTH domain